MLKRSFIYCYMTWITVPLNLEYILFITLLTVNQYSQNLNLDLVKRPWKGHANF